MTALAVGPAALVGVIYLKLDVVIVGLLEERADLGIYGAAYQPIEYLLLVAVVVMQVLFPFLAATALSDHESFEDRYRLGSDVMMLGYGLAGAVIIAIAPAMVDLLYEAPYAGAATPMMVLGASLAFMGLNVWQGAALLAVGQQHRNLIYLVAAVLVNVVVDLVLIVALGPVGAAWGTLITAVGLAWLSTVGARRHAGVSLKLDSTIVQLAAAGAGALAGWAYRQFTDHPGHTLAALPVAVVAWGVVALRCRSSVLARIRRLSSGDLPVSGKVVATA